MDEEHVKTILHLRGLIGELQARLDARNHMLAFLVSHIENEQHEAHRHIAQEFCEKFKEQIEKFREEYGKEQQSFNKL